MEGTGPPTGHFKADKRGGKKKSMGKNAWGRNPGRGWSSCSQQHPEQRRSSRFPLSDPAGGPSGTGHGVCPSPTGTNGSCQTPLSIPHPGGLRIIIGDKDSRRTSGSFPFCRPLGATRSSNSHPTPSSAPPPHPKTLPATPRDRPGMDKPSLSQCHQRRPSPSSASPPVTGRSLPGWAGQLRGSRARQEPPDPPKSRPMGTGGAPKRGLAGPGSCVQHLPLSWPSAGMGVKAREL